MYALIGEPVRRRTEAWRGVIPSSLLCSCVEPRDDLVNRDAVIIRWLQRHEAGSVRCRVVKPFETGPPIESAHDQQVCARRVVRTRAALQRVVIMGHQLIYRGERSDCSRCAGSGRP